jgi:hypothetical protein
LCIKLVIKTSLKHAMYVYSYHGNATMTSLCTTDAHIADKSIKTSILPRERNNVFHLRSYRATKYIVLPQTHILCARQLFDFYHMWISSRQIFTVSTIKFHEDASSGSSDDTCGWRQVALYATIRTCLDICCHSIGVSIDTRRQIGPTDTMTMQTKWWCGFKAFSIWALDRHELSVTWRRWQPPAMTERDAGDN